MPQVLRPRPIPPAPLEPSPPLDPATMPSPPPAPPAAAEDQVRPSPPMKLRLLLPHAVSYLLGGMGRAWGMALVGFHALICVIKVVSFTTEPEVARFWVPIFHLWVYLGLAIIVLMTCVNIAYYVVKFDPLQKQPAEPAAVLLPPPPPEMDMC